MARRLPVVLTGHDAKRCARRIHNDWDPTIPEAVWEVPATLQKRFDGREFEDEVLERLMEDLGTDRFVDLRVTNGVSATTDAMEAGIEVVIGGWLPRDVEGARTGRPDLLIRVAKESDGWKYVPGDIKGHLMTQPAKRGTVQVSRFPEPATLIEVAERSIRTGPRFADYLQLAHYWRMLEAIGRVPSLPAAAPIIGTDVGIGGEGWSLFWLDLEKAHFQTFSRSLGKVKRSALERYDHEHNFRVEVADVASRQGDANPPVPLVQPVFIAECDTCPWQEHCLGVAGTNVASAAIRAGRLGVREWVALGASGIRTVEQLADLEPTKEPFRTDYLAEVTDVAKPLDRLANAIRRARMVRDEVRMERITVGPVDIPRADVEIDLDIEWDDRTRVYLWGFLVGERESVGKYHAVATWEFQNVDSERRLAEGFVEHLRMVVDQALAAGRTVLVYHYSHPEPHHLKRILGEAEVADLLDLFVDLRPIVAANWFGVAGLGLKEVAPVFGFSWRAEDAGGLQSQVKLDEARGQTNLPARDDARTWILDYNEDDVRATYEIRNADWG